MSQEVYLYDRLVIGVEGAPEREPVMDSDRLRIVLSIKNPIGSLRSTMRPPNMEVWDAAGRVFEATNADWAEPLLPDTEIQQPVEFDIAPDAEGLQLVLGPGETNEVRIPIDEVR
jgi:hypothetical protein